LRYIIVMGCAESREKEKISSISSFSFTKSPLPLHIYPNSDGNGPYTIKTPKSSPKSSITASVTTSLITSPVPSPVPSPKNVSPKNVTTVATTYITRLTSIAHHKFSTFSEFPKNVQTEILHHIDKELRKQ
jgi:hypothetical protein